MKKFMLCLFLCTIAIFCVSCTNLPADSSGTASVSIETGIDNVEMPVAETPTANQMYGKLRMLSDTTLMLNAAADRYYQLELCAEKAEEKAAEGRISTVELYPDMGNYWYNLYCINYATRQKTILCSESGCQHKTKNCTAWMPYSYTSFVEAGNKVLVIRGIPTIEEDETTWPVHEVELSVMDYDGKNKNHILNFYADAMSNNNYFTDDESFYFVHEIPPVNPPLPGESYIRAQYERQLILMKINLETGKTQELYQMHPAHERTIGTLGDEILFLYTDFPESMAKYQNEPEKWEEIEKQAVVKINAVNKTTGAVRTLEKEYSNHRFLDFFVVDGWFYYTYQRDYNEEIMYASYISKDIYRDNLVTGETEIVFEGDEAAGIMLTLKTCDGKMFVNLTNDIYSLAAEGGLDSELYLLPLEGGNLTPVTLYGDIQWEAENEEQEEYQNRLLLPVADAGEYFLLLKDEILNTNATRKHIYYLILKEDYWAGNANYIPITMVG